MSTSSAEFAENSVLDFLIPHASEVDIEDALGSSETARDVDDSALITSIPQRNLLFFDEKIPVYVVLRTRYLDETQLKANISSLAIILEAHAISTTPHASHPGDIQQGNQTRDVIWSGKVNVGEDPIIVVEESDDDDNGQNVLLIWKLIAFLTRPRIRLQAPAIIFKLSASLQPLKQDKQPVRPDPYLPSGVPLPVNLLQSLEDDPTLKTKGIVPRLSDQRLSRTIPASQAPRPETLPIKIISRKAFRAIPALSARMKYHKASGAGSKPTIIASLDIEIPAFAPSVLELRAVKLQLTEGIAQDMVHDILKLPMQCRPRDSASFLYRLEPHNALTDTASITSNARVLEVSISAVVLVSSLCRPQIEMRWRTSVDFSATVNPSFGKAGQSMQRTNRPASLPTPPGSSFRISQSAGSAKNSTESSRNNGNTLADIGITIAFSATGEVRVGEPFRWDIFIVNRSPKTRKLVITVIPKRKRMESKNPASRPSSSASNHVNKAKEIADPVTDENILYTAMKMHSTEHAQLVCLSTDMKIGPLGPGACYATELRLLPLASGFLHVEAVRIVDVASGEAVDVHDLPDIEALDRILAE
ncbi:hypothetical protein MMC30_002235 [Trapelia coarctata]|nr:hypothetical protein [Trapelia coarctata]